MAAVALNTFRESVRERVLYNLVFFAILMTLSGLLLRQLSVRQDEKIIKDLGLGAMDLFGTLIAVLVGVQLVSKEIERRSLYALLARPLSRGEFLVGKFFGLAFTLLVNTGAMATALYATLLATRRAGDPRLLVAVYSLYLGLLVVVALALLFSTLTSSTIAAVCVVSVTVAGRFSDVIRGMHEVAPSVPGWLTTLLYYTVPNLRLFDLKDRVVYGDLPSPDALAWLTLYAVVYVALVLCVAAFALERTDLK